MIRLACGGLVLGLALTPPLVAGPVDPPVSVVVKPAGEDIVRGRVTAFDREGFDLVLADGASRTIGWSRLDADRVFQTQRKLLDRNDARGWYELTALLFAREDGKASAERAASLTLALDGKLTPAVERLRAGESLTWEQATAPPPESPPESPTASTDDADTGGEEASGPVSLGDVQAQFWGDLSPELMASSIAESKKTAVDVQQQLGLRLALHEDAYFLFYSDLPADEARRWAGLLEQMYDRLLETFALEPGKNIFRGKCLIFVFRNEADYHRYHRVLFAMDSAGTAGLCRSYGNGFTEVSFYRQRNDIDFAHVLVHETVHAFVHRYRSYPFVPSWINEGLAEYIAFRLVDSKGFGESEWAENLDRGIRELKARGSFGGYAFFDAAHIEGWQYIPARLLCEFMIVQDPQRYRAFIDGIKDGKSWQQALTEDYGTTLERLVSAFGAEMRMPELKP